MIRAVWILFLALTHTGTGVSQHTRYERTRYVSSRNQIYGGDFDFSEKYIPFVHYWERPLQILESSMKIPKKLSSRPLFSWDIPVQISTYTPSKKISTTENSLNLGTEMSKLAKKREPPDADIKTTPHLPQTTQRSRLGRAKASMAYPHSFALIPTKKKKSSNREKPIQETEKWKEFDEQKKAYLARGSEGRSKKKKKIKKSQKGKSKKNVKRKKPRPAERLREMNDMSPKMPEFFDKKAMLKDGAMPEVKKTVVTPETSCELEKKCEHRCERMNGKAVCVCFRGFTLSGDRCLDINECETNNGDCNGRCVNTIGSRKCICTAGFRLVDGLCTDINECLLRNGHGPCQDQCTNTLGSYYCSCDNLPGTSLSSDNHTCKNTRECNPISVGCSHSCISLSGTSFCTCPEGMELGDDWKTCHDIDECSNPEDYGVRCEFGCVNTIGSYKCKTRKSASASQEDNSA